MNTNISTLSSSEICDSPCEDLVLDFGSLKTIDCHRNSSDIASCSLFVWKGFSWLFGLSSYLNGANEIRTQRAT